MNKTLYVTEIRAYSSAELADIYQVSKCTLNRWLKPLKAQIGKREGRYFTARQVSIIFELLGLPAKVEE